MAISNKKADVIACAVFFLLYKIHPSTMKDGKNFNHKNFDKNVPSVCRRKKNSCVGLDTMTR